MQRYKLSQLSQQDRKVYEMMNDPNNAVMMQLKYGGDEAL